MSAFETVPWAGVADHLRVTAERFSEHLGCLGTLSIPRAMESDEMAATLDGLVADGALDGWGYTDEWMTEEHA